MLRTLWKWLAASFSLVVILLAIAIGLFRLLLPTVPQYHERIEAFASEVAGTPVRIEGIDARWGLAGPQLRFSNAELLTADGTETLLSAANGSVVIDLGALFRRELRAGRILLDGLRLEVVRDAQGRWLVGGRVLGGGGQVPERLSIGLREAEVLFRDEPGGRGPWLFEDVDLNVELRDDRLSVDGLLDLPGELGGRLELSLQADGDLTDFGTLDWQLYTDWRGLELAGWSALLPAGRVWPAGGAGDAVVWFAMEGNRLQQASLQLDLSEVVFARDGQTAHELSELAGRFEFDRIESGWQAAGRDLRIASAAGAWPPSEFSIEQVGGPDGSGLTYADFDYLRLQDLAPLADWIPAGAARDWVLRHEPRGVIEDLSLRMTREQDRLSTYSLRGAFDGLGVTAANGLPGFDRVSGDVRLDDHGGRLQLDPAAVRLHLPTVLGEPVETRRTSGVLVWRRSASGWRVVSDNVAIDHAAFRSSSSLEVTLPTAGGPRLDLYSYVSDVDVAAARSLLPRPILKPKLRTWLDEALVGGRIPAATISWNGTLDRFPFDDGSGEFAAIAEFEALEMAYARNWPVASALVGTISLRNAALAAEIRGGEVAGNRVQQGRVSIADLREGVLRLDLGADGPLERLHGFLLATPLLASDSNPLARTSFTGSGSATVDVTLPLKNRPQTDIVVDVTTADGSIGLDGVPHRLEKIAGSLRFRNGDLFGQGIDASLLGAPVEIEVHPETLSTSEGQSRAIVATGRGVISDEGLKRLDALLPTVLSGSSPFTATLTLPRRAARLPATVEIASRLEGMAVRLPPPLDKPPGEARNTVLTVALPPDTAQVDLIFGDTANARLAWRLDPGSDWRFDRGTVQLGVEPARLPEASGLEVGGSAARLDVDGWLALGGGDSRDSDLVSARVRAQRLTAFGQEIDDAVVTLDRNPREWLVQIDSAAVAGGMFVPFDGNGPIVANMERLFVNAGEQASDGEEKNDSAGEGEIDSADDSPPPDPRSIPELDINADDFRLGRMQLGNLSARLRSLPAGIALEALEAGTPAYTVTGSGSWTADENGQETRLELRLDSANLAATLVALGFDDTIDADEATIELALQWPGPPGQDFKERLDGTVSVRVGPGQLKAVQPGAGRVFGLLSFTALPRRLSLDFRDVFDKGFGFDYIEGDFTLDDGNAFTSNLVLDGPAAQVGIAGRTGLVARDYDQTAVVYGNFGAALPVAGAIAGGPVGGAAMLIFSELFKKPLQDMARINYRITGSWDDPEIERVLATDEAGSS